MLPVKVIIGGQYGSEGKGAFLAHLLDPTRCGKSIVIRTGGPQAGHSMRYEGETYAMRMIPCGWHNPQAMLALGPGALIDLKVLLDEIEMVDEALHPGTAQYYRRDALKPRLVVDPNACMVESEHHEREAAMDLSGTIGSTKEGVGAAQASRVLRQAKLARDVPELQPYLGDVPALLRLAYAGAQAQIFVESTQGFLLSLTRSGLYPNVTSRDITPAQVLNDAGIPTTFRHEIYMVMRTHPIRISGPSGPLPHEVTWEELNQRTGGYVRPEITTVTKKIRRVADWDSDMAAFAVEQCTPHAICLTFGDYWWPHLAHQSELDAEARERVDKLEKELATPIRWVSLGFQEIVE